MVTVTVTEYMTLTFNADNDLGDPDLTQHGPAEVEVPADWTGHMVERAIEAKYGHPVESVGVSGGDCTEREG